MLEEVVVKATPIGKSRLTDTVSHRLHPTGALGHGQLQKLKALKNKRVDEALSRNVGKPGEKPKLGANDSDFIKQLINKRK